MKRIETVFISVAVSILFSLTILLVIGVKNCNKPLPSLQFAPSGLRADGDPVPPFPPKLSSPNLADAVVVVADGDPVPPFPQPPRWTSPNLAETVVLVADGDPVPPFPHPPLGSNLGVGESRHEAVEEGKLSSV